MQKTSNEGPNSLIARAVSSSGSGTTDITLSDGEIVIFDADYWKQRAERAEAELAKLRELLIEADAHLLTARGFISSPDSFDSEQLWLNWNGLSERIKAALTTPAPPEEKS